MHLFSSWLAPACALLAVASAGRSSQHVGRRSPAVERRAVDSTPHMTTRPLRPREDKTSKFRVDGKKIPDVSFDVGESYAGLLPISTDPKEARKLYFWYFPTANPDGKDDITIWLNGGPGCSSLEGLLQENGPFLWQYGTLKPVANPYSWTNLTNMIWVEQPVGTGFTQGEANATSEADVARQFLGFFRNFLDTFDLKNRKIYIAGESYAGYFVPYIADAMFAANDTEHFDVQGTMIYDPSVAGDQLQQEVPAAAYALANNNLFGLNASFAADVTARAKSCGYTDYLTEYLAFPPPGPLPTPAGADRPGCGIWNDIFKAVSRVNPCFDVYHIATTCPLLWDVLGFPGSFDYLPQGAKIYFSRPEVQKAINAPVGYWAECVPDPVFVNGRDRSEPSSVEVLPRVIDRSRRTIIGHGVLDYILIADGTLLAIQNMTFGSPPQQGFQKPPTDEFLVPAHADASPSTLAGAGVFGKTHTERKLTWVEINLSGHMVPQYAPSAAFRMLEFLLGRVDSLTTDQPFTVGDSAVKSVDRPVPLVGEAAGTNRTRI